MNDQVSIDNDGQSLAPVRGGFEQNTVSSTALDLKDLVTGLDNTAEVYVELTVEDADIRLRADGSDPTASVGKRLYNGVTYLMCRAEARAAKVIAVAGDATIQTQTYAKRAL